MTERRFVLVEFRYSNDAMGHVRLYDAGLTYDMRPALAHAAPRRQFVAKRRPADWIPPSILKPRDRSGSCRSGIESLATPRI
jgi:hypothetical protein